MTNSLSFLPQFDEIIMLENGSIAEMGTFEELKQKQGIFNDFVKNHLNTEASKEQESNFFCVALFLSIVNFLENYNLCMHQIFKFKK